MSRYGRVFNPQTITRMREMAENGRSAFEIAQAVGSTVGSIRVVCSRHKIRLRRGRRGQVISLPLVRAPSIHDVVAHMPASLYAEFYRKAEHLQMSPSVLASNLLAAITISNIFEAVLDDDDDAPIARAVAR
jgi:predicted nuclease with RNAse H fold